MLKPVTTIVLGLAIFTGNTQTVGADDDKRSVKVTGTAVASVKPDTVVWSINVTSTDADLQLAREANDEGTREVLAMRDELGIDAKDLQTGNLSIRKIFERDRSGNQGAFRHYSFRRSIMLRQRDVARFDDILQKLTAIDNVEVSYSLESSEYHEVRRETRLRAVAVAREKANEMTTQLDARLGHVLTIDETERVPGFGGASNLAFDRGPSALPDDIEGTFSPGSIEIRVSVEIRFAIE